MIPFARYRSFAAPTRSFLVSAFLWGMSFSVTWLYLNFLFEGLGFSPTLVGAANAVPQLASLLFALPVSRLAARLGYVRTMRVGAWLAGLGLVALGWIENPLLVFATVGVIGLGGIAFWVVPSPLMAVLEPSENRTYVFTAHFALSLVAGFIGSLVGGWLPELFAGLLDVGAKDLPAIQATIALSGALYLVAAIPLRRIPEERPEDVPAGRLRNLAPDVRRRIVHLLLPNALIGLGAGLVIPFLNIYIEGKFGVSFATLGAVFAWSQLGMAVAMLLQPVIAERLGKVRSVVLVQALSLPFIALLGFADSFALAVIALFVRSALMNAANPIFSAFEMEVVDEAVRPTLAALHSMVWSAGWIVGPVLSGAIRERLGFDRGFDVLFGLMLALYAIGIAYTYLVLAPLERRHAGERAA